MTITLVAGQSGGASGGLNGNVSKAFAGNVAVGDVVIVFGFRYNAATKAFAAGDCTKSAGTATLGAITLDAAVNFNSSGSDWVQAGLWSAQVTGAGSCTMQLAPGGSSSFVDIGIAEFISTVGAITFLAATNKTGTGASGAPATASATSTGNSIFAGAVATVTSGALTHTVGATYTQVYEEENGANFETGSSEYKLVGIVSSTADWAAPTTVPWAAALAVYQEPAAAGGDVLLLGQLHAMTGITF